MKRSIMLALALCVLIGCASPSIEKEIKSTFKTYVEENFGNPDNFIEIVKIELVDTISTDKAKNEVREIVAKNDNLVKEADSLATHYGDKMLTISKDRGRLMAFRSDDRAKQLLLDAYEASTEKLEYMTSVEATQYRIARDNIDTVLAIEDSVFIIQHKIKVRLLENNEPIIKDFYSLSDQNGIRIYDRVITMDDYPKSIADLYDAASKLYDAFQLRQDYTLSEVSADKAFIDYIELMSN